MKEDLNLLIIRDAGKEDEGAYKLEAVNEHGSVTITVMVSVIIKQLEEEPVTDDYILEEEAPIPERPSEDSTAEKVVRKEPPRIVDVPEPVVVQEGDTIWLSCRIAG